MKDKALITLNVVLVFAVILLYLLHFKSGMHGSKCSANQQITGKAGINNNPAMAYIVTDTLLAHYEYYKTLKKDIEMKQARSESEYNQKSKQLESDYYQYQERAQKGTLSKNQMQEQEQSLQQRNQELMQLNQKLSADLADEDRKMQKQLFDSIKVVTEFFNADNKFTLIFNNASNATILSGSKDMDITGKVLLLLNERYKISGKK